MANEFGDIIIENVNELGFKLKAFGDKIANQVTRNAANEAAKIFKEEAINNINNSVRPHRLKVNGIYVTINPGNLKKNIRIKTLKRMTKNQIEIQVYLKKKEAWYGIFVERGTSKMAAQAFMTKAYENKQSEAFTAFNNRVSRAISEGGL